VRLLLAAALLVFSASPAHARELRIHNFHAELVILPDATLDVTETIEVEFIGSWQGIYRTIPVEYDGPGGFNYSLFVSDVYATGGMNGAGQPLRLEKSREGPNLAFKIYVPGANDATRSISVHYRVRNGLRFFEDHDELYWNVTGSDWPSPIAAASAHVVLPQNVTGMRAAAFAGPHGSRAQDATVQILESNVDVRTLRPLAYREGLTIVVGWDKGFVRQPSRLQSAVEFLQSNWPLFAPLAAFVVMFGLWYTRGRDPDEGAIAVQYEPPEDLSPGEVGTLVDDQADMRDLTATIVDLAVRGYLTIEEREAKQMMGLYSTKEYVFHRRKPPAEWAGARPHELLLLAGLFSNGLSPEVSLSQLQNKFYKNLPGIRNALYESLHGHHLYRRRPDKVRQFYVGGGIAAGVLLFGIGQYAAERFGMSPQPFIIGAILTAGVICAFGWFMPARTSKGARARLNALGFEEFLGRVEADRFERMPHTPETFEKYLPFAMALGVEKKWAAAFATISSQPPSWYQGPPGTMFHPAGFVNSLSTMSARASQAMASAPRGSSRGSGFGGGGFSGGGFGGGGGRGF
jgi:hypothetical protein